MTQEQLEALLAYIEALAQDKVDDAFNRSGCGEAISLWELKKDLYKAFNL